MSIQGEIDRLSAAKASIAASLQAMGIEPPEGTTLEQYAAQLAAIATAAPWLSIPGGGTMQMGESLGDGPYTIEVTEDGEGGGLSAEQVGYSNTGSGLEATNVQGAIDELAGKGGGEYLPLAGGTMKSGATIQGTDSLSIISPQQIQIATGSTAIRITGNTIVLGGDGANTSFFGTLNMGGYPIKSVPSPVDSTDAANKQYVDEHAGSRVILGSYVGTGKSGKSNPNQITLAEPFKVLWIYGIQHTDSYVSLDVSGSNIIPSSIIPTEYTSGFGFFYSSNYSPTDSYGKKSADGKTFSWYFDLSPASAANVQFNASGDVYHYYAIV